MPVSPAHGWGAHTVNGKGWWPDFHTHSFVYDIGGDYVIGLDNLASLHTPISDRQQSKAREEKSPTPF